MAQRGPKNKPVSLKLLTGNPGKRPLTFSDVEIREYPLAPHVELNEQQQALWDKFINTAWWLSEHDAPKAFMWICLELEFESNPEGMNSARISQLRALGSELGLDPSARARMPFDNRKNDDPAEKYFN